MSLKWKEAVAYANCRGGAISIEIRGFSIAKNHSYKSQQDKLWHKRSEQLPPPSASSQPEKAV